MTASSKPNRKLKRGRGRPPKPDKEFLVQATVRLRRDTIQLLRDAAGSARFGEFLQKHLDRYPPKRTSALSVTPALGKNARAPKEVSRTHELFGEAFQANLEGRDKDYKKASRELRREVKAEKKEQLKARKALVNDRTRKAGQS